MSSVSRRAEDECDDVCMGRADFTSRDRGEKPYGSARSRDEGERFCHSVLIIANRDSSGRPHYLLLAS